VHKILTGFGVRMKVISLIKIRFSENYNNAIIGKHL
jgi:hypothetical protein